MTKHKTDMNITKIGRTLLKLTNTKKLNSTSLKGHKTGMNITEKLSTMFTTEHKTEHNYTLVNRTINMYKSNKGVTNLKTPHKKRLTKIFNQQLTSIHYLYPKPKSQKNVKLYNLKNKQNHKINTTSLKENKIHTLVSKLLT